MSLISQVKEDHGILVSGSLKRFQSGEWFGGKDCDENCSICGSNLLIYRRPYTTSAGKQYHYWGIVCLGCRKAFHPDDLENEQKKRIYNVHKLSPVDRKREKAKRRSRLCILANSVKNTQSCIAGIEMEKDLDGRWRSTGRWVRPISHRPNGAISDKESFLQNRNRRPELFDIVEIPLSGPAQVEGQPEDWLIEEGADWLCLGHIDPRESTGALIEQPKDLWLQKGVKRDRVTPEWVAGHKLPSLYLIQPEQVRVYIQETFYGSDSKRSRRVALRYNDVDYDFAMTDPVASAKYFPDYRTRLAGLNVGISLDCAAVCVSLAPAWKGGLASQAYHYKLVAGIIEKK